MAYKYKLSEMSKTASPEVAEKELDKPKSGFKVGDVSISDDGTTKSTIYKIDDETGQISWKIEQLPGYDKMFDELDDLVTTAKRTANKSKDDPKFREFYDQIRQIRNQVRTHIRKFHPEIYKRIQMRMTEATGVDGDVMDLNPSNKTKASNYVKLPHHLAAVLLDLADELMADEADTIKNQPQIKQALALLKKAAEKAMTGEKEVEEISTSGAAGAYNTPFAFKLKKKKQKDIVPEGSNDPGASLGPGPKAGADGVSNSAYTKQFKYRLVPKTKDGTYVQKGSGMIVKNLF